MAVKLAEPIGKILNTNPPSSTPTASKSEHICDCGNSIKPVVFEQFGKTRWPRKCRECEHKDKLQAEKQGEREEAARIQKVIDSVIPPLFRKAKLKHLPAKLQEKMLNLPPNKGLLLFGPPGVGKSYAMCALMRHYLLKENTVKRVRYGRLCLEIRSTYGTRGSELDLIKRYQDADKLFIEDVGATVSTGSQESDFSLRTFLEIIDERLESCKPTFITTNKSVEELSKTFDERIASRLRQACEILPVKGEDKRV